jgi:hypothetical protein
MATRFADRFGNRVRFTPYRIAKCNKVGAGRNQRRNRLK